MLREIVEIRKIDDAMTLSSLARLDDFSLGIPLLLQGRAQIIRDPAA